ncbi:6-pyruvoyltetrahydropterin/6-carboxytetrahydropterin synthase [Thermosyntropha lipolytica DSM 11003]|uniref:6-carboxy-5,6,7,8-tetrahydropterin synthase n=1 Tax=Thermosyntropha lipolytica DSM 11003 TaxID=1123382 RepID=A0A1M5PDF0_9FIRM|nr:6-carboxytetrahydropterin synthase QueD [Thermosyntropha lipolytica]SHG99796.1 6-pyruvoyltetrahydropterin/6-carboxytetrahydropterin synthase [Thermosyntropha lipolytica DSM 11003]
MAYELGIIQEFAAAHRLNNYPGDCSNIHGHTWKVEITVKGNKLDPTGMLIDFRELKRIAASIIKEKYDHRFLNEIEPFDRINPTAENIAREIYYDMKKTLTPVVELEKVKVWESPTAYAVYKEE